VVLVTKKVNETVPKSRWVASLSNGETIFEDHLENEEPAWERLKRYVVENELSITNLRAQFNTGLEITLPPGQEGYIQKKKAWITSGRGGLMLCIGYVQGARCLIHEGSSDGDSISKIGPDPGEPWTIYSRERRCLTQQ